MFQIWQTKRKMSRYGTEDFYDWGCAYAEPHIEELLGDEVYWTVEDEDLNEYSFYISIKGEFVPIEEGQDCWGGDYDEWTMCMDTTPGGIYS